MVFDVSNPIPNYRASDTINHRQEQQEPLAADGEVTALREGILCGQNVQQNTAGRQNDILYDGSKLQGEVHPVLTSPFCFDSGRTSGRPHRDNTFCVSYLTFPFSCPIMDMVIFV